MTPDSPQAPTSSPGSRGGRHAAPRGRGVLALAALAAVLLVAGIVVGALALRGAGAGATTADRPPQPAAVATTPSAAPSASPSTSAPAGSSTRPTTRGTSTTKPGSTASGTAGGSEAAGPDVGDFLAASQPTKLKISSIGLSSSTFVPLTVKSDGVISVPGTADEVGLYAGGPTPGQLGPAVLAAHVDTPDGRKGIFWKLGAVKAGDTVTVTREDGTTLTFTVDRVQAYKKTEFPTDEVYKGDFTQSQIRLVTCGGPTDSHNEYRDNVVVFGHLTSVKG